MLFSATENAISLQDLGLFDQNVAGLSLGQGGERRCLCPLCGHDKPRDSAHRSLSLNTSTGLWRCHRCGENGKIRDAWEERSPLPRRERARAGLAQTFALPVPAAPREVAPPSPAATPESAPDKPPTPPWKRDLRGLRALNGTRAVAYLSGRGLCADVAGAAGARFSSSFMGRPAIVFPLRDQSGVLRGAHARYVDGRDRPKARTLGDKRESLFATAGAFSPVLPALIVTEAPLDALSLAHASYPALAVCGTEPPVWFHRLCAFRRVLLAFDADDAGERAADKLAPMLESFGARCERLAPDDDLGGAKDWNEALQTQGRDNLADWLAARVLVE